jgi:hypothetical protein
MSTDSPIRSDGPAAQTPELFTVLSRELWGDYGDILMHGMVGTLPRQDGLLQLERTGPFVPPVSLPEWETLLVRDAVRVELERLRLPGVRFQPVRKTRIVQSDWNTWDLEAHMPARPPVDEDGNGGEPEDYVLRFPHSDALSEEIGPLWEVVLPVSGEWEEREAEPSYGHKVDFLSDTWEGHPLFLAKRRGSRARYHIFATRPMRDWLEARCDGWLVFVPVGMK